MAEPPIPDRAFGDLFVEGLDGDFVLIGFPLDDGSIRSGGRRGSELGPDCLRRFLPKAGPVQNIELNIDLSSLVVSDYGNIDTELGFDGAHAKLREKVARSLGKPKNPRVCVIGGSGDTSSSSMLGFLDHCSQNSLRPIVIRVSASIDTSPLHDLGYHSTSALRPLLEDPRFVSLGGRLRVFGAQGTHVMPSDYQYVIGKSGDVTWLSAIRSSHPETGFAVPRTASGCLFESLLHGLASSDLVFLSLDLSSIASAYCPGVSRPSSVGLTSDEVQEIIGIAAKCPQLRGFEVIDYNPAAEDWRTGRLVALLIYEFAAKLVENSH